MTDPGIYYEPWRHDGDSIRDWWGRAIDGEGWLEKRAVAAVNACAGLPDAALTAGVVALALELATCQEWDSNGYCWWCGRQNYAGRGEHTDDCKPAKVRRLLDASAEGGREL